MTGNAVRQDDAVLAAIERLGCPYGFERSVKLSSRGINADRFLATLHKDSLGTDAAAEFAALARRLGLAERWLAVLSSHLAEADIIHVGHEYGAEPVVKLYIEFANDARDAHRQGGEAPRLVHLAVKWRPGGQGALSRYWLAPALLAPNEGPGNHAPSAVLAAKVVAMAAARCGEEELFFMRVEEEGTERQSFDVNVYAADLTVGDIGDEILALADAYGIEREAAAGLVARIARQNLGHISGGNARDRSDFATLYFGVEAREGRDRG